MTRDDESDVSEDMSLFEAAVHAPHLELTRPALGVVLVVLDGSNQDATARALATAVAERTGAAVAEHAGAESAAEILAVCSARKADLVVVPVPFGRDIGQLKDESLGSVVDMLLQESARPVLCVRELLSDTQARETLADMVLAVIAVDEASSRAASWALRILAKGGQLQMLAVADREVIEEAHKLLGQAADETAFQPEALAHAVGQQAASLTAAIQKGGEAQQTAIHVEVKVGRAIEVVLEVANQAPRLIVIGAAKDHSAPAFHRARDLVLGARGPVMVV